MRRGLFLAIAAFLGLPQGARPESDEVIQRMISRWREDVRRNPEDYETWTALGSAYGKLRRYNDSLASFNRAIEVNPKYAEAYLGLGITYGFLRRPEDKIRACQEAIKLKPAYAEAYANLGAAYGKLGKYDESIQALREALRLDPKLHEARLALGLAFLSSGDIAAASRECDTLDRDAPSLADELRDLIRKVKSAK